MCRAPLPSAAEPLQNISAQIPEPGALHKPGWKIRLAVIDNLEILAPVFRVHTGKNQPVSQGAVSALICSNHSGLQSGAVVAGLDKHLQRQTRVQCFSGVKRYGHACFGDIERMARKTAAGRF